jgi:hypothetical protein
MSKAAELAALIANVNKGSSLANKNIVINGAMNVAQRGTSSTSEGYKTVDRFFFQANNEDNLAFTQAQSTDAPTGFSNSYKIDCTTVESALASDELAYVAYKPEAQDCMITLNGTADAKPLTLSFYVKSNKTGNYAVALYKPDNTGRVISKTYTISSADTWEKKEITFAGDTSGGGLNDDSGEGIDIYFTLMAGSDYTSTDGTSWQNYSNAAFSYGHNVNMFDNTANEWLLTGVQLEIGEKATEFSHEPFETTLTKCHRYYQVVNDEFSGQTNAYPAFSANRWGSNQAFATVPLVTPLRGQATISIPSGTGMGIRLNGGIDESTSAVHLNTEKNGKVTFYFGSLSFDPTNGYAGTAFLYDNSIMTFDAEL